MISKNKPEKRLLEFIKKKGGRGNSGRITVRHRGGGAKKLYRLLDFGQEKINQPAQVLSIEYDPFRTAYIALLEYSDKDRRYVIAPQDLKPGDEVMVADQAEIKSGNRLRLKNVPVGIMVFNIELEPDRGGKLVRSAGSGAKVLAQDSGETQLVMPSGEVRKISGNCFATLGTVSHSEHMFEDHGKAGANRWRGIRPTVRGTAMNPVDHPHGGGEGKTPIGLKYPKTPWGKPAKGVKTRRSRWTDKFILQRRKKK
ncbi:MAG: 50S ribosomal protein L2 [Candidatus Wildermuthbacteria bacterium GWA2_46_15]|uniref:Large ribosomal subunit protein uL2 n=1 Tax=Candidatus Wildermuthbacteria bacterium GWA2_46_15 TaxID=1802443 RepID=A0A1G2QPA8_9BACT|nr:MAG: 50S ribosomal protein L2 [Candidatus Wildermuthbacteria bacterium GWA2_46_15]